MSNDTATETEYRDELTPHDILDHYHDEIDDDILARVRGDDADDRATSLFVALFTPPTRTLILDALVSERGRPMTAQQIADHHPDLSVSSVNRHRDALISLGVVAEGEQMGNARTFRLNSAHPVAGMLGMIVNIFLWGETPLLFGEQFVSDEPAPTAVDDWRPEAYPDHLTE